MLGPNHCARSSPTYTYSGPERIGNDARALTMLGRGGRITRGAEALASAPLRSMGMKRERAHMGCSRVCSWGCSWGCPWGCPWVDGCVVVASSGPQDDFPGRYKSMPPCRIHPLWLAGLLQGRSGSPSSLRFAGGTGRRPAGESSIAMIERCPPSGGNFISLFNYLRLIH